MVLPGGRLEVKPYQSHPDEDDSSWQDPAWGAYKQQGCVLALPIMVGAAVRLCRHHLRAVAIAAQP